MKKGFTLIELMAVIIVLGIVAVLSYPIIGDTVESSKKNTFYSSLEGIYRAVDMDSMRVDYERDSEYTYDNGVLTKTKVNGSKITSKVVEVKGKLVDGNGTITIDKDGNIILSIETDKYCGYTTSSDHNIKVVDGNCTEYAGSDNWTDESCFGFDSSTGTITSYDESCGVNVVIPRNINGVAVKHIGDLAFTYTHEDVNVYADDSNEYMLLSQAKARGLESYYVDGDVTSMEEINSIDFTNATDLETIGVGAFYGSSLTSIDLSNLKKLEIIGNSAFESSCNLTTVNLKGLIKLKKINNSAFYANNIDSIDIKDSIELTIIDNDAFTLNRLTRVDLSGLSNLTTIGDWAFTSNNLTSIDLSGLSNLTAIGDRAFDSNNLTTIDLSGLSNLTTIGDHAFFQNNLTTLDLSGLSNLTTIGNSSFYDNNLTTIDLSGLSNLTTIGSRTFANNSLEHIPDLSNITNLGGGAFTNNNVTNDSEAIVYGKNSDGTVNNTILNSYANGSATTVNIPSTIVTIQDCAFYDNNLTTIDLSGLSSLTTIGEAAFYENNLTTIDLSGLSNLTAIGDYAFSDNNLTTIDLNGLSNLTTIGYGAFYKTSLSNKNLTTIYTNGKTFDWGTIINGDSDYNFITGTVENSAGNVTIATK